MDYVNYTDFRKNLAGLLDKVNDDCAPILITRQNGKPAVLMSLDDFRSYDETAYLLASPENAKRLYESIEDMEAGNGIQRDLIEE